MQNVIKNMYKIKGLFVCKHPLHERFDFAVSPYHILKQKKCYKQGCIEFLWRCNISNKGKKCPRGYKHVGRNCFSCKYYYEEKICRVPETLVDNKTLKKYLAELEEYEYWLSTVENKRVRFSGEIAAVVPSLLKVIDNDKTSMRLTGFLIKFERGHIGYDLFDDTIYLRVGSTFLKKHIPAPDDEIELEAQLINDRGRVILIKPSHVELDHKGGEQIIDFSKALVGKTTGADVLDDIRLCRDCPYGSHLEVQVTGVKPDNFRRFYCLRGVEYAYNCPVRLEKIIAELHQKPDINPKEDADVS